jgi:hypothetical protein
MCTVNEVQVACHNKLSTDAEGDEKRRVGVV